MKGSDFVFDYADFLYLKSHKGNLKRGRSYIDFLDSIKKTTINFVSDDDKCFQYAETVALN